MALLVIFIVLALIGQTLNLAVCLLLERIYPGTMIIPIFFVFWVGVFWGSWRLALWLTEPQSARRADGQQLIPMLSTALHAPMVI